MTACLCGHRGGELELHRRANRLDVLRVQPLAVAHRAQDDSQSGFVLPPMISAPSAFDAGTVTPLVTPFSGTRRDKGRALPCWLYGKQ